MIFYAILSISAFLVSLLGTRLTILALRKRTVLMDIPNLRSNHVKPVPRGGGIAVVFAMLICLLGADMDYSIGLSLLLLLSVSLLDDIISLPPYVRLIVQAIAVAIPLSLLKEDVFGGLLPVWLDRTVVGILWLWFINLFNFMDGIDGLASVETISICAGLALPALLNGLFPSPLPVYGMITASAVVGFLWWNWHPAKIFLGDVGSIPLGFFLGYLLLIAVLSGYPYVAIIMPAYYIVDSTVTLLKRLFEGKKIWQAHSEHFYQRAVRAGRTHSAVTRYIFGVNILLGGWAMLTIIDAGSAPLYVAVAYLNAVVLLWFFAHTKNKQAYEPF